MGNDSPTPSTRRRFVNWLLGTSAGGLAAAVLYPVTRYLLPPEVTESATASVTLPFTVNDIPLNSGKIFKFGSLPGILVHTPQGEFRAFSATCTHLACIVQYRDDLSHIWCACHNGHFDLNGRNIIGPPPKPLEVFTVRVSGEQIIVSRGA
ncbi:MAG: ubiquinol-cytochrome c reductase iron-sulfur subunit [Gemmatimonadota bacterium]|nr:ubiquinol-cytochrome c reductase iron-sulfur subunit [Gemmatimonadota bacterium]